MDRQSRRWLRVGMVAPLMLWMMLAAVPSIWAFEGLTDVWGEVRTAGPMSGTERVSLSSDGTEGNGASFSPSLSSDGRYVAFDSWATNLVDGDTNGQDDVFMHDRQTGITERVSLSSDGMQGNGRSFTPSVSADGRYVAFVSDATNLVDGDTNGQGDIFLHDRLTGTTDRISVSSEGAQGNGQSVSPSISGDGRYVAFTSYADNLVAGDANGTWDIFVHDRQMGQTKLVSRSSDGTPGNDESGWPSISTDGRFVAYLSWATNLVDGDINSARDVFVQDRQTDTTQRISVSSHGAEANDDSGQPSISEDGRSVAFYSWATNLVDRDTNEYWDVFVHDRLAGTTERVSVSSAGAQADGGSSSPSISGDGRFVAFGSFATNLVEGHFPSPASEIYVRDRLTGETELVSVALGGIGIPLNGESVDAAVSGDGRIVAFSSWAFNLVEADTNYLSDVFVSWGSTIQAAYLPLAIRE